jgi:hypothetical protein
VISWQDFSPIPVKEPAEIDGKQISETLSIFVSVIRQWDRAHGSAGFPNQY